MASTVCSRAAVFTSSVFLGLPFGLPDVPLEMACHEASFCVFAA